MKYIIWMIPLVIALIEFAVIRNQKNEIVESQSRVERLTKAEADRVAVRIPAAADAVKGVVAAAPGSNLHTITETKPNPAATLPVQDRPIFDQNATFPPRMAVNSYGHLVPVLPPPSDLYQVQGGQAEEPTRENMLAKLPPASGGLQPSQ